MHICSGFNELLGKMVTMVTCGTIRTSTRKSEGTTRRDPSFLRAERRKKAKAAKCCLDTTAQLGTRCLDNVQTSSVQVEGLQEKSERKTAKRAGRRDRHRVVGTLPGSGKGPAESGEPARWYRAGP